MLLFILLLLSIESYGQIEFKTKFKEDSGKLLAGLKTYDGLLTNFKNVGLGNMFKFCEINIIGLCPLGRKKP